MELRDLRTLWTAKAGNRPDECEDAYAFDPLACRVGDLGVNEARIAVSDGASESAFARNWSQVLTRAFVDRPIDLPGLDQPALESWLALWERVRVRAFRSVVCLSGPYGGGTVGRCE